jgi:RecA/RadA recombinase
MKLNGLMEELDATILIVNQVSQAIGVMYGNPEVTSGGKALEFYCSQRFRTSAHKQITNPKLGNMVTGVNVKIANKKNRFFRPHAYAEGIQLLFDKGINPLSGLLEVLIQAERIEASGPGNYKVKPEYLPEGAESYNFKSSKVRGDVPRSLVFDCPKIIDAATRGEVEAYLEPYANFETLEADGSMHEETLADMLADEM